MFSAYDMRYFVCCRLAFGASVCWYNHPPACIVYTHFLRAHAFQHTFWWGLQTHGHCITVMDQLIHFFVCSAGADGCNFLVLTRAYMYFGLRNSYLNLAQLSSQLIYQWLINLCHVKSTFEQNCPHFLSLFTLTLVAWPQILRVCGWIFASFYPVRTIPAFKKSDLKKKNCRAANGRVRSPSFCQYVERWAWWNTMIHPWSGKNCLVKHIQPSCAQFDNTDM